MCIISKCQGFLSSKLIISKFHISCDTYSINYSAPNPIPNSIIEFTAYILSCIIIDNFFLDSIKCICDWAHLTPCRIGSRFPSIFQIFSKYFPAVFQLFSKNFLLVSSYFQGSLAFKLQTMLVYSSFLALTSLFHSE